MAKKKSRRKLKQMERFLLTGKKVHKQIPGGYGVYKHCQGNWNSSC